MQDRKLVHCEHRMTEYLEGQKNRFVHQGASDLAGCKKISDTRKTTPMGPHKRGQNFGTAVVALGFEQAH